VKLSTVPSSVEVKNRWSYTSTSIRVPSWHAGDDLVVVRHIRERAHPLVFSVYAAALTGIRGPASWLLYGCAAASAMADSSL
jgi:hypothetical protein